MISFNDFLNESSSTNPPFIDAAQKGYRNKIKLFLKNGADINMQNKQGLTALMYACLNRYLMVVYDLVEAGADVNLQDNFSETALMVSSTKKIINKLLEGGADVNIVDKKGNNVVMRDILRGMATPLDTFKLYLENGLNLDTKNKQDNNLYDLIMLSGYKENYVYLIQYIDEKYPQYKEEWELKQNVNKFNL
jgi:ankyrin repeat protein